jgi:hypothetical protein
VQVLFQETVTARESEQVIFPMSWRVQYRSGGEYWREWYAVGVGLVQLSSGGEEHELVSFQIVE